jgi:hypothetical protein
MAAYGHIGIQALAVDQKQIQYDNVELPGDRLLEGIGEPCHMRDFTGDGALPQCLPDQFRIRGTGFDKKDPVCAAAIHENTLQWWLSQQP